MTTITPLFGQSIFDIALKTCGIAEAAYDIALASGVSITDNVEGDLLVVPEVEKNKRIVEYYAINSISPATDYQEKTKKHRIFDYTFDYTFE
ncbi:MAG: hypothetical protein FWC34_09000 [Bacteroidetes bacterium]|nr:hypothetical protein [Bacteroidota bacterium]